MKGNILHQGVLFVVMVFCVLFFGVPATNAQQASSLELRPAYPTSNEKVRVTFKVPSIDFDTALVTWKVNGQIVQQSYSENMYEFTTEEVGTLYSISASATDGKGKTAYAEKSFRVSDLDVVWEGRTYTQPFYKGRALYSPDSEVVLVAIPRVSKNNGEFYNKEELSYTWTQNSGSVPDERGKGKYSVVLKNNIPSGSFPINIEVKDPYGNIRISKNISIPVTEPSVVLYEYNPLIGVYYDSAIGNTYTLRSEDSTILAEPFFMSAENRNSENLLYSWDVDGTEYTSKGALSFGVEGEGSVTSNLELSIRNSDSWLQKARTETTILFGAQTNWATTPETIAI